MKPFRKKAIASLAALSLVSIFSLTPALSTSAVDYTNYVSTIDENTYLQAIKSLKARLEQRLTQTGQLTQEYGKIDKMEQLEIDFLNKNKKEGIVWKEGYSTSAPDSNYVARRLEDSFTIEAFKSKFHKSEGEATSLSDYYLVELMDYYQKVMKKNS
ncbi:hypothetical protein [Streptococcus halichoeri]|uniref:hypothetical protein n=1 Tax=Streptococcus halichoeri TaxID=254785 RepID=UPI001357DC77|nr:hypothetical protein [Streptococcus halichoeri]